MDIRDRLSDMTIEEKASLLCGASSFRTKGVPERGIPGIKMLDGGTGMNFEQLFSDRYSSYAKENGFTSVELLDVSRGFFKTSCLTEREKELREYILEDLKALTGYGEVSPGCYPPGVLLGATWDPHVVKKTGEALGMEALVYGIDCLLGTPNVNLLREPRNGRFFEGYSEDPFLAASLAGEFASGVEATGVCANVKHFAANNLEINRTVINEHISERALRELYLPAFKACVDKGVSTVMAAYNSVNGKKCVENRKLLREILKDEWNFKGAVVTDWGACTGRTGDAVSAGTDIFMPGPWDGSDISAALGDGRLTPEELDDAASRVLALTEKCGGKRPCISFEEYKERGDRAAYNAASEGIVLLKNNGALPVRRGKIVIFSEEGTELLDCGSGSAQVFTDRHYGLDGYLSVSAVNDQAFWEENDATAIVIVSMPSAEGADRKDLEIGEGIRGILDRLIRTRRDNSRIVLVLNVPGPVTLRGYKDAADAVIFTCYPGMMGTRALADIITGKISPSGKLPFTWPVRYEDTPAFLCYPDGDSCTYGEGIFAGYRGYEIRKIRPDFPFGHGLTYSDFSLEDVSFEEGRVNFTLENKGTCDASQVVQIYVGDPVSTLRKPVKELKAFGKYFLKSGEKERYSLSLSADSFKSYDESLSRFALEEGYFHIYAGFSSEDIRETIRIRIEDGDPAYKYGINSPAGVIAEIPELREALVSCIKEAGLDLGDLLAAECYVPSTPVSEIYPSAGEMVPFIRACEKKKKD